MNTHTTNIFGKRCFEEFLKSGPWAVSSNSQPAGLPHPLVTCNRPRLTCAPHEGVFAEQSLGSWLKFSANSAQPAPCHMQSTTAHLCSTRGSFLQSSPWAVSSNSQLTVLGQYLVTCRRPQLTCAPREGDFLNSLEEDHLPIYVVLQDFRQLGE